MARFVVEKVGKYLRLQGLAGRTWEDQSWATVFDDEHLERQAWFRAKGLAREYEGARVVRLPSTKTAPYKRFRVPHEQALFLTLRAEGAEEATRR